MKAKDFIKQRLATEEVDVPLQDNAKFFEVKLDDYVNTHLSRELVDELDKTNRIQLALPSKELDKWIPLNIVYSEDADFEYFTMERCVCDGTLAFMDELATVCFNKILGAQTVNAEKMPNDFMDDPFKYEMHYTIGDFVCCEEFGDFGTEEKPWMKSRFTVMLPIKFDIKEKKL